MNWERSLRAGTGKLAGLLELGILLGGGSRRRAHCFPERICVGMGLIDSIFLN